MTVSITVRLPKRWWQKLRLSRISVQEWSRKRLEDLLVLNVTDPASRKVMYPGYIYKAFLRKEGLWTRQDPFRVHWFPHARFCPAHPLTLVSLRVPDCYKTNGTVQLQKFGLTWSEFWREKLEDWCLPQEEYDKKQNYWQTQYLNYSKVIEKEDRRGSK